MIYGFHESPRFFKQHLDSIMKTLGWTPSNLDPCLFYKRDLVNDEFRVHFFVWWTDDGLLMVDDTEERLEVELQALAKYLPLSEPSPPSTYLGMKVHYNSEAHWYHLSQPTLIQEIISLSGINFRNSGYRSWRETPRNPNVTLSQLNDSTDFIPPSDPRYSTYRSIVGKIGWLALLTRFDIAHTYSVLARYYQRPTNVAWRAVQWLAKYLVGTETHGLTFGGESTPDSGLFDPSITNCDSIIYSDSSYADNPGRLRSTGGYFLQLWGSPIDWMSKVQSVTTLSSMEAEVIAACDAAKEACWYVKLFEELFRVPDDERLCITLAIDNTAAQAFALGLNNFSKTKHISVRYQFIQQCVENDLVNLVHVPTAVNNADIFTKALNKTAHAATCKRMGLRSLFDASTIFGIQDFDSDDDAVVVYNDDD
jgi:hypothetical protein